MSNTYQPILIGVSPAGVEWVCYRSEDESEMRKAWNEMFAKAKGSDLKPAFLNLELD